jgi:hypothetical protein
MLTATIHKELTESGKEVMALLLAGPDVAAEPGLLPIELQRVLQLRQTPRLCFVLRVLEGWPREKCAIALGIPADTVDAEVCNAAQDLAFWGQ